MNPSFREILELLNKHEVEYIVVGGVAAVIQGAPVTTFDLDTLIRVSDDNAERLSRALEELDARYREHQSTIRPTKKDVLAGEHLLLLTRAGPLRVRHRARTSLPAWRGNGDRDAARGKRRAIRTCGSAAQPAVARA
jgi:hypothetical protein